MNWLIIFRIILSLVLNSGEIDNSANVTKIKSCEIVLDLHLKKFRWMESLQLDSLSTLLHDEVYYIHSNGWKETKKEVLENLHSGKLRYHKVTVTESDCRLIGDMAIVTGKGIFQVSMEGAPLEIKLYYTEVYSTSENTMRLVSRHACRVP